MPDSFKLKPLAIGFVNYGFATKEESDLWPGYAGRPAGAPGVLLNKARSGNGPAGTGLDSKKNFSWQDRAVFPGSLPLPNGNIMMYYDDLNTPYLLEFSAVVVGKDYTINVHVRNEFGLIGSENQINEVGIQLPTINLPAAPGDDYTLRNVMDIEQSPDGRSVFIMAKANFSSSVSILGNAQRRSLAAIIRVDISGEVKKGLPQAGLAFSQSVFKTTAECSTKQTVEAITQVGQLTVEQQAVVAGGISDLSGSRVIEQSIRYAYFDNNGGVHFYGFSAERTTYHLEVAGQNGNVEVASPCYHDIVNIHLNGSIVDSRTTSSCNYYHTNENLPVDSWGGTFTWNESTVTFESPIYDITDLHFYYKGIWQGIASASDEAWIYAVKDTNSDGEYDTSPVPSVLASAGIYSMMNIGARFISMNSNDPRTEADDFSMTTVHSGYGNINVNNLDNSNLAYDHINGVIEQFSSFSNNGSFQQIPVGFVSSAVFY